MKKLVRKLSEEETTRNGLFQLGAKLGPRFEIEVENNGSQRDFQEYVYLYEIVQDVIISGPGKL